MSGKKKNGIRIARERESRKRIRRVYRRLGRGTGWLGSRDGGSGRDDRTEFVRPVDWRSE
jgi:hypothetical protein